MTTGVTTQFDCNSTTDDVLAGVDLTGKRAIVTGASSRLGTETARALACKGAEVALAVRDTEAGKQVAAEITSKTGNANVHVAPLDLTSHASIAAFTKAWTIPLHILVNNAGTGGRPELEQIPEGWEQQFATNHLGHFELTMGLHDALASARNARVVVVSSDRHHMSPVVFEDIHFERRGYEPFISYAQSKTANVLFAVEANKRWAKDGITVNAIHPGLIRTNLARYIPVTPKWDKIRTNFSYKSLEQGAATQVFVAASPLVEGIGGRYFEDCHELEVNEKFNPRLVSGNDVNPHAVDPDAAAKFWDVSLEMLKQRTAA